MFHPATGQKIVIRLSEIPFEREYDEVFPLDASQIQSVYGGTITLEEGTKFRFILHHDSGTTKIVSLSELAFSTA